MNDKQFVDGMIVKRGDNAPDFVLANTSINIKEHIAFLESLPGPWANFVLKRAKSGKCYAEVDNWKPADKLADVARERPMAPAMDNFSDEVPF